MTGLRGVGTVLVLCDCLQQLLVQNQIEVVVNLLFFLQLGLLLLKTLVLEAEVLGPDALRVRDGSLPAGFPGLHVSPAADVFFIEDTQPSTQLFIQAQLRFVDRFFNKSSASVYVNR